MRIDRVFAPPAEKLKFRTVRSRSSACAVVLAAAAILPAAPARGSEAPLSRMTAEHAAAALPLPAVPYLETMPWLSWQPYRHGLKVDTLLLRGSPLEREFAHDPGLRNPLDLPTS